VLGVTLAVSSPALALIGGQVDALDRFPAVVAIAFPGGGQPAAHQCTATKIGPVAFLTAAHCVVDHTTARAVMDDADPVTLTLIHGVGANAVNIPVRLRQTLLPPAYEAALGRFRDYKAARLRELGGGVPEEGSGEGGTGREPASGADPALGGARRRAPALAQRIRLRHHFSARFPDVAVLIVAEPTPAIPTLAVDLSPLAAGAEVARPRWRPRTTRGGRSSPDPLHGHLHRTAACICPQRSAGPAGASDQGAANSGQRAQCPKAGLHCGVTFRALGPSSAWHSRSRRTARAPADDGQCAGRTGEHPQPKQPPVLLPGGLVGVEQFDLAHVRSISCSTTGSTARAAS